MTFIVHRLSLFFWFVNLCIAGTARCATGASELTSLSLVHAAGTDLTVLVEQTGGRPSPLLDRIRRTKKLSKKATAAILAFPFPFGIVGLHRIYMGTSPYVPVVYIATLGGVFGILPLIDFIVILAEKDIDRFVANKNVFMWVD